MPDITTPDENERPDGAQAPSNLGGVSFFPAGPGPIRRQLSLEYDDNGTLTAEDPAGHVGAERRRREDALLRTQPSSGYAIGILERRAAEAAADIAQEMNVANEDEDEEKEEMDEDPHAALR